MVDFGRVTAYIKMVITPVDFDTETFAHNLRALLAMPKAPDYSDPRRYMGVKLNASNLDIRGAYAATKIGRGTRSHST